MMHLFRYFAVAISATSLLLVIAYGNISGEGSPKLPSQPAFELITKSGQVEEPKRASPDLVATIIARPLFEPDRRPTVPSPAQVSVVAIPRLAGIMTAPGYAVALFQQEASPKPVAVKAGEVLEKVWAVAEITGGHVTLDRDGTVLVLTPHSASHQDPPTPETPRAWKVGLRRSDPLPSYLQRQSRG